MSGQVGIVLDGVMRKHDQVGLNPGGMMLYRALEDYTRVAILATGDPDRLEHFLKVNKIYDHALLDVTVDSDAPTPAGRRLAQVQRLRRSGYVEFVVEPDPAIAAALVAAGVPTLLFAHPQFAIPTWRPDFDGTVRPWDDLVTELDRQQELRADEDLRDKETL
jgi:hypothetical protein